MTSLAILFIRPFDFKVACQTSLCGCFSSILNAQNSVNQTFYLSFKLVPLCVPCINYSHSYPPSQLPRLIRILGNTWTFFLFLSYTLHLISDQCLSILPLNVFYIWPFLGISIFRSLGWTLISYLHYCVSLITDILSNLSSMLLSELSS